MNRGTRNSSSTSINVIQGAHRRSEIYIDNMNYRYYKQNTSANRKNLRCVNYATMRCRGSGDCKKNNTDFRLFVLHTCAVVDIEMYYEDCQDAFIKRLKERSIIERTSLQVIYNEEKTWFPRTAEYLKFLQVSKIMQNARRGDKPPIPGSLREWGAMISSDEWSQRYKNVIGNQSQFYQGELAENDRFFGLVFCNKELITMIKNSSMQISVMAISLIRECAPMLPGDLRQFVVVQIVHNNMCFPVVYACLEWPFRETYLCFMRYILSLHLPYYNGPVQLITEFQGILRSVVKTVFPTWQLVACPFHFVKDVYKQFNRMAVEGTARQNKTKKKIVRMILGLPHLPANVLDDDDVEEFTIVGAVSMMKEAAYRRGVYIQLVPFFHYLDIYWIDHIGPQAFSVYGSNLYTRSVVETFHQSLIGYFGTNPLLWTFYDRLRSIEKKTRLQLTRVLNGQQVRKIFPVPKIENNIIVQKALRRAQNGRNPSKFLKQIAPINDPFIKNNMIRARPRRRDGEVEDSIILVQLDHAPGNQGIDPNDTEDNPIQCVICYNGIQNVTIRPCGHKLCNDCSIIFIQRNIRKCALCRQKIREMHGIEF